VFVGVRQAQARRFAAIERDNLKDGRHPPPLNTARTPSAGQPDMLT
jgi:hypothetical protein